MYPTEVPVNEESIKRLTIAIKKAYKQIFSEIEGATDFGVANRRAILKQIEKILESTGTDIQDFLKKELPEYYKLGADDATKQLKSINADIPYSYGFNSVHKEAILALVDDTARAFGETLTGVSRSANLLLGKVTRELITQKLAEGTISGQALKEIKKTIIGTLKQDGLSALVDKGGHTWTLDRYSEMLIRTKAVEARNRGFANRLVQNGYDLVQVSRHNSDHEECAVWEGKILSLRGETPGYPTVADAEKAGLFHPNCKHAINAIKPKLARLTYAYDNENKTVVLSEEQLKPYLNTKF